MLIEGEAKEDKLNLINKKLLMQTVMASGFEC